MNAMVQNYSSWIGKGNNDVVMLYNLFRWNMQTIAKFY